MTENQAEKNFNNTSDRNSSSRSEWSDICPGFADDEVRNSWIQHFTWKEAKEWFAVISFLDPSKDLSFLLFLKNVKQKTANEVSICEDLRQLRNECQQFREYASKNKGELIIELKTVKDELDKKKKENQFFQDQLISTQKELIDELKTEKLGYQIQVRGKKWK